MRNRDARPLTRRPAPHATSPLAGRAPSGSARRTRLGRAAAALALASVLAACAAHGGAEPAPATLPPDRPYLGVLVLDEASAQDFRLALPADTVAVTVELECSDADLSLDAQLGETVPEERADADFSVEAESGRARLAIDRFSDPVLAGDVLALRVAWRSAARPRSTSRELDDLPYTLRARLHRARKDGALAPGHDVSAEVGRDCGGFRSYALEVPAGVETLRLDLLDTDGDLDLLARAGAPIVTLGPSVELAQHPYGRETLVVHREADAVARAETWWIDVVDPQDSERDQRFRLRASFAADPPADLLQLPALTGPRAPEVVPAELLAVVELETDHGVGSGTLVSADGWILTNAHVVEGRELPGDDVVVAVCLDPTRPPVEMFRGHVEFEDTVTDLALVRVRAGFYGQPLPPGYRFPELRGAQGELPPIGTNLRIAGYPLTGGQGTRVSISLTRGIVAGYDRGPGGVLLKTDAEITNGNSGGAALDDAGRLVGVPSATVENGSGQIGYVHPLALLPAEWIAASGLRFEH